jgi:hypothetical protein
MKNYDEKNQNRIVQTISDDCTFAQNYLNPELYFPRWEHGGETFLFGISHLDLSSVSRRVETKNLEIFAYSLLDTVFFLTRENYPDIWENASEIVLRYHEDRNRVTMFYE